MRTWNFLEAYSLALTYLGLSAYSVILAIAEPAWLSGRAARKLVADLEPEAREGNVENHEGFFAGLEDGDFVLFGPSMGDRKALLPYIGRLCGGDSR